MATWKMRQWHAGEHSQGDRVGWESQGGNPNRDGGMREQEATPQAGGGRCKGPGAGPVLGGVICVEHDWLSEHLHEPGLGGLALARGCEEAAPSSILLSSSLHAHTMEDPSSLPPSSPFAHFMSPLVQLRILSPSFTSDRARETGEM